MLIELLLDCISETMQGIKSPELEPSEEMQGPCECLRAWVPRTALPSDPASAAVSGSTAVCGSARESKQYNRVVYPREGQLSATEESHLSECGQQQRATWQ